MRGGVNNEGWGAHALFKDSRGFIPTAIKCCSPPESLGQPHASCVVVLPGPSASLSLGSSPVTYQWAPQVSMRLSNGLQCPAAPSQE